MKISLPLQLSVLCSTAASILFSFQFGVHYAANPYRALAVPEPTRLEFTKISIQQSHTLLITSIMATGFTLIGVGLMIFYRFRENKSVPFSDEKHLMAKPLG